MPQRPEHLHWVVPRWWATGNTWETETSRETLIGEWTKRPPPPSGAPMRDSLHGWCADAAEADWVAERYTVSARARIRDRRKSVVTDPDGWDQVSSLIADYLDSFARCSISFQETVQEYRPPVTGAFLHGRTGKKRVLSEQLREVARTRPATAARVAMINEENAGQVFASQAHADEFLADPGRFMDVIKAAAMRGYGEMLLRYMMDLDNEELFGDSTRVVVARLEKSVKAIEDAFGPVKYPPRRLTATEKAQAVLFADQVCAQWLIDQERLVPEGAIGGVGSRFIPNVHTAMAQGFLTLVETDGEWSPQSVDELRYIEEKFNIAVYWARREFDREETRRKAEKAKDVSFDPDRHGDTSAIAADDSSALLGSIPDQIEGDQRSEILAGAVAYLRDTADADFSAANPDYDGPEPCWERKIAMALCSEEATEGTSGSGPQVLGGSEIAEYVSRRHEDEQPHDAMRASPKSAAELVRNMLQEALVAAAMGAATSPVSQSGRITELANSQSRTHAATEMEQS